MKCPGVRVHVRVDDREGGVGRSSGEGAVREGARREGARALRGAARAAGGTHPATRETGANWFVPHTQCKLLIMIISLHMMIPMSGALKASSAIRVYK